jgi:small GTP-binding protein
MSVPAEPARAQPDSQVARPGATDGNARRVALIGVPNCGKSLIFNRLTGRFSTSANYPYTTVDIEEAQVTIHGQGFTLFDTPGITGLELTSEDEAKTRELLRDTAPDVIVQCLDAGNVVRSLILTAQLADLQIPTVICVNMVDEASNRGLVVDYRALGEQTGVPVVPVCALDGRGIEELTRSVQEARVPFAVRRTGQPAGHGVASGMGCACHGSAFPAGEGEGKPNCQVHRQMALKSHHLWAQRVADLVVGRIDRKPRHTVWKALANAAVHPIGAWAFLLLTMVVVYLLVVEVGAKFLCSQVDRLVVPMVALISSWTGSGFLQAILAMLPLAATVGVCGVVLVLELVAGSVLRRLIPEKGRSEFLVELPPIRRPIWGNVLLRTYRRIAEFVTEAVPLFMASAAALFVLHTVGLLDRLRDLLAPVVVTGLGLPRHYADVLMVTLARREMGAVMLKNMAGSHRLGIKELFIALLVIVLFVPCLTTGMVLGRVLGWRRAALVFASVTVIAIAAGMAVHLLWV